MQELGTDTNLYALVFGESVLNDAVSSFTINLLISDGLVVHFFCLRRAVFT